MLLVLMNLGVSLFLSSWVRKLKVYAIPDDRSSHQHPIPTTGGLAVLGSFFFFFFLAIWLGYVNLPFPICIAFSMASLALGGMSFWDDYHPQPYLRRLSVHVLCAFSLILNGLILEFPGFPIPLWFLVFLTVFLIVGLINAANFIDGLNGLLSGCIMLTLVFMWMLLPQAHPVHIFSPLLLTSVVGFFVFNFPKASLFLGDVGSTFLGFCLGFFALLVQSVPVQSDIPFLPSYLFYLLFPLSFLWTDIGVTLFSRFLHGKSLAQPHREYSFLRLHDHGWSHAQVSVFYFMGIVLLGLLEVLHFHRMMSFIILLIIYGILQTLLFLFLFFYLKSSPVS